MTSSWATRRGEITVLDCTIRDGGLVNGHHFSDDFVRAVYKTCLGAGIDTMECGYLNSPKFFSPDKYGVWMYCREEDLRRIVGENKTPLKLSVMIDCGGKSDWENDLLPKSQSVIDICRIAFYANQTDEATAMINHATRLGYEVWANLMAASLLDEVTLDNALVQLAKTPASVIVVVDSFGAMLPRQVACLVEKYRRLGGEKEVGIHTHNNQQLAFANSIAAIESGANRIDASLAGLGRGAGNCPMELLLGYLGAEPSRMRPVFETLEHHLHPLSLQEDWGPFPEYMITGQCNAHPNDAMAWRDDLTTRDHYTQFFDRMHK
ncbi:MAG: aldolase catalytic domain-containing protein [Thermoguttaceae bacterium]